MIPGRSRIEVRSFVDRCARDRGSVVLVGDGRMSIAPGKTITVPLNACFREGDQRCAHVNSAKISAWYAICKRNIAADMRFE